MVVAAQKVEFPHPAQAAAARFREAVAAADPAAALTHNPAPASAPPVSPQAAPPVTPPNPAKPAQPSAAPPASVAPAAPAAPDPRLAQLEAQVAQERAEAVRALQAAQSMAAQLEEQKNQAAATESVMAEYRQAAEELAALKRQQELTINLEDIEFNGLDHEDAAKLLEAQNKRLAALEDKLISQTTKSRLELEARAASLENTIANLATTEQRKSANAMKKAVNDQLYAQYPDLKAMQDTPEYLAWAKQPLYPGAAVTKGDEIVNNYKRYNADGVLALLANYKSGVQEEPIFMVPGSSSAGSAPAEPAAPKGDTNYLEFKRLNDLYRDGTIELPEYRSQLEAYRARQ